MFEEGRSDGFLNTDAVEGDKGFMVEKKELNVCTPMFRTFGIIVVEKCRKNPLMLIKYTKLKSKSTDHLSSNRTVIFDCVVFCEKGISVTVR